MKIKKLNIAEFQQFKNLELDFTYPEGHEKAGQPLEKVCFIGQSGAGKTTLLEIFNNCIYSVYGPTGNTIDENKVRCEIEYKSERFPHYIVRMKNSDIRNEINKYLIYFKSELLANQELLHLESLTEKEKSLLNEIPESQYSTDHIKELLSKEKCVILSDNFQETIWHYLLADVKIYDQSFSIVSKKLALNISNGNSENIIKEFEDWKKENPDPRIKIADKCLNPILNDFNLKVHLKSTKNAYFPIQHIDGTEIPPHGLSTGTKQVLLTALPIYLLNTKDTIILFDEPERSLFPDIQLKIVDYYTQLAPEAQFFFATHSPMVAAAFEPYERFILSFDEAGYVTSDSVYKGDSPIGDDPNDMLKRDFGVRYINEYGIRQWEYYLDLKKQLRAEKDEEKKKELMLETAKLGNLYKYPV